MLAPRPRSTFAASEAPMWSCQIKREWSCPTGGKSVDNPEPLPSSLLEQLLEIERSLWQNDPETYYERFSPSAVLLFPGVGRIDRDTAVKAIRMENDEGRAWAEAEISDVDGRWIAADTAALITYSVRARWNYEASASKYLCGTVYRHDGPDWHVASHQQTAM
jgi:hypothetical protein